VGDLRSTCPSRVLQTSIMETLRKMTNRYSDVTTGSRGTQVKERGGSIGYWWCSILWRLNCDVWAELVDLANAAARLVDGRQPEPQDRLP